VHIHRLAFAIIMNAVYTYMFLALVLITASQALAQTPIIILPCEYFKRQINRPAPS
jgi:hypothetical protein